MNAEQARQLFHLDREMLGVQRSFDELAAAGWEVVGDPLAGYKKHKANLLDSEQGLRTASPEKTEVLVIAEAAAFAATSTAARDAEAALKRAELDFFAARDELVKPFDFLIAEADEQLRAAIAGLHAALWARWFWMRDKNSVLRLLFDVSQKHGTTPQVGEPTIRFSKPFANKKDLNTWSTFCGLFFERLLTIVSNNERTEPVRVGQLVFERPAVPIVVDSGATPSNEPDNTPAPTNPERYKSAGHRVGPPVRMVKR